MSRFEIYNNEVLDTRTGLIWRHDYREDFSWYEATAYAKLLEGGWRLPTRIELFLLIDDTRCHPATEFPDMPNKRFWSLTPYTQDSSYAWLVSFDVGNVNFNPKAIHHAVRCVKDNLVVSLRQNLSLTGRF